MRPLRILLSLLLFAPPAAAATYEVGPGKPYASLENVEPLLEPGDIVEIQGDHTYPGDVQLTRSGSASAPITIRGIPVNGRRPVLSGGTNTLEVYADHYVVENLDLTEGSFRCFYHHGHGIVLRDSVVHHCPAHGILGADTESGSLTADRVEVHNSGNGDSQHAIYMATDETDNPGAVFRLQNSWLHDNTGGNNVKSRAERNEIYFNWIQGTPDTFHELELIGPDPSGGVGTGAREDSDVVGNVLMHDDANTNFGHSVRFGGDATGESDGRYRFVNNTFVDARRVFRAFDAVESIEMHNNVLYRASAPIERVIDESSANWSTSPRAVAGSRNWVQAGSGFMPPEWTETTEGTDPGFADAGALDFRPAAGSPLIGAGTSSPAGPAGQPFPSPLFPPAFEPPMHTVLPPGATATRLQDGAIDMGAFEHGSASPGAAPPPGAGPADTLAPRATRIRFRRSGRRWRMVLTLSEDATVRGRVARRRSAGYKRVKRVKPRALTAGRRRIRLGRLRPGRHRVRLALTDAAGNRAIVLRRFRVRRR